ncbi:MAG: ComF family protein [Alphaproteobacteria bacterium]|nr:ComF family protein [Alphaproteobacteria bacterium]
MWRDTVTGGLKAAAAAALDLLLPPRCIACGAEIRGSGACCAACWERLSFLGPPACARCGLPFDGEPAGKGLGSQLCATCIAAPPRFDRARAALRYDDASRPMILALKHGDRLDAAPRLAAMLLRAAGSLAAETDLIAPVPLHWTRLFVRSYNQSAILANHLARLANRPVIPDLLQRRRRTPVLGGLTRRQRARAMAGAIRVHPRRRGAVEGRRILLVDDVMTTGATIDACCRALLSAGARSVDVVTLARVLRAT